MHHCQYAEHMTFFVTCFLKLWIFRSHVSRISCQDSYAHIPVPSVPFVLMAQWLPWQDL